MTSRLAGYTSFAGAPEGAEQRVKFIYKTAETPAETARWRRQQTTPRRAISSSACGTACWRCSGCKNQNNVKNKPPESEISEGLVRYMVKAF